MHATVECLRTTTAAQIRPGPRWLACEPGKLDALRHAVPVVPQSLPGNAAAAGHVAAFRAKSMAGARQHSRGAQLWQGTAVCPPVMLIAARSPVSGTPEREGLSQLCAALPIAMLCRGPGHQPVGVAGVAHQAPNTVRHTL